MPRPSRPPGSSDALSKAGQSNRARRESDPGKIDSELLKLLRCPDTRQGLHPADSPLLEELNRQAAAGQLKNRAGQLVRAALDGGLVRADGKFLYPIRENIPVMLMAEAIPLLHS